ncbi:MAG: sporulation protein YunB [Firmicutes bacterium]|nr:sporulation protein YunB [Bacillota bacterium]
MPKKFKLKAILCKKRIIALAIFLAIIIFCWWFIVANVNPILRVISEEKVRELTIVAINNAADQTIDEMLDPNINLVEVEKNNNGNVEMFQINTLVLNSVSRRVASLAQQNVSNLGRQGIFVPIGTLSGLTFLTGRGPSINIQAHPVGTVDIHFLSNFSSAGINQTRHTIRLIIEAEMSVIIPGVMSVSAKTELILTDTIIVGQIPDTVLNLNSGRIGQPLNFIP